MRDRPLGADRPAGARSGFTLIELLTVIIIIGLLASILLPTVTSAISSGYVVETMKQRDNLAGGAEQYAQDHRRNYPGQDFTNWSGCTGSQVLAACLFDYIDPANSNPFHNVDGNEPPDDAKGRFAAYKEHYLTTLKGKKNTLSDLFPKGKEMAFCYYPAKRTTGTTEYNESDNSVYYTSAETDNSFSSFTFDSNLNQPINPRRFLLIAPGADRLYFSGDDIKNW